MSAVRIKLLSSAEVYRTQVISRGIAAFLLTASILLILFAGTFPFDFATAGIDDALHQIHSRFDWNPNPYDPGHMDRIQNILFFMPFGFALAAVIRTRRLRRVWQIVGSLALGFALTMLIESLQALVSFRDPSVADIWCNTLGSLLGTLIYLPFGDRALRTATHHLLKLERMLKPSVLAAATVVYALVQLFAPLGIFHSPGDLSVWDTSMPLVLGNEINGERPWDGHVHQVILASQAATAQQVAALSRGGAAAEVLGDALLADYELRGEGPYKDLTGNNEPLVWTHPPAEPIAPGDVPPLTHDQSLQSAGALAKSIYRIGKSSEFTFFVTASTFDTDQRGPARIAGISAARHGYNIHIGQEFQMLSVRPRTAVHTMPELYVENVFTDTKPHSVAVTHQDAQIVIYVDGIEQGRVEITPEAKMIWRLYPRGWFRLRLERYGFRSYAVIYRALVLIPFAALLGATLAVSRLSAKRKRLIGVGGAVAMSLAMELLLGAQAASGFQIRNLLISLVISLSTLGLLALRKRILKGKTA
jgi:glycopeptide antibiotics resistance protein